MGHLSVCRARVCELLSTDPDHPASPAQRAFRRRMLVCFLFFGFPLAEAQQRGVKGTRDLLLGLVDGLELEQGTVVYVVDALPNKFNELGRAMWELQCEKMKDGKGLDWRFVAYGRPEDGFDAEGLRKTIAGNVLTARIPEFSQAFVAEEWWDQSAAAGPPQRPSTPFGESAPPLGLLNMVNSEMQQLYSITISFLWRHCVAEVLSVIFTEGGGKLFIEDPARSSGETERFGCWLATGAEGLQRSPRSCLEAAVQPGGPDSVALSEWQGPKCNAATPTAHKCSTDLQWRRPSFELGPAGVPLNAAKG